MCIFGTLKVPKGTYVQHVLTPQTLQLGVQFGHFSLASDIHLICIFRGQVSRGAKPRGEVAKPKTELAHRDRFIKVASGLYL